MQRRRAILTTLGTVGTSILTGCAGVIGGDDGDDSGDNGNDSDDNDEGDGALFVDEFDDGTFEDIWAFKPGNGPDDDTVEERDGVLYHQSPKEYSNGADLFTQDSFEAGGSVTIRTEIRSYRENYWGFGFGISFDDGGGIRLKEQKWGRNSRLQVAFVVPNGENALHGITDPASPDEMTEYGFAIDFENRVVRGVGRGSETFDGQIQFPDAEFESDTYSARIGIGRGHEIEYGSVRLSTA